MNVRTMVLRLSGRRNCWTCKHSGQDYNMCSMLTGDEDEDRPILDWLQPVLIDNGTVTAGSDNCPGWGER
jgi:hypothetical protein